LYIVIIGQDAQLMTPYNLKCCRTKFHQTWMWG